ncbi:YjfB family protein [Guyparkeria hydrothermalis]|uniref:putative motility protein n=1 Tax=Guyparkeria hydrothermalis TaxID=923 RepID=UPI002021A724|nr:YjfB family protein [Guyparkeria hydrothermalis]MCL7743405.1 YjfB family protein [Guyparkeria hydrothermalis]
MADPVSAANGMQAAMANLQLAQEIGVRVQKEAMETQEKAMAPLLESIAQGGGQSAAPSGDGPLGGQINTYA